MKLYAKRIELNLLLSLHFTLTQGYLNPALKNLAQTKNIGLVKGIKSPFTQKKGRVKCLLGYRRLSEQLKHPESGSRQNRSKN